MGLGEYLRKIRKENKKTLVQLAEETGLSHSYLSQVENGKKTNPSMETLKKIAEACNRSYLDLWEVAGYAPIDVQFVGYADDLEKQFGIRLQKQNEKETPSIFAGDDILFQLKSNPNVSLNLKPLKDEDKQKMTNLLKAAFPEYFE